MKIDKINYQDLIDLGFSRHEMEDDVLFKETGYSGFCLEMEFDNLDIGISSGCSVSNDLPVRHWQFNLYRIDSGDTIRRVELIELKNLIEHLQIKSEEISKIMVEVKGI